MVIRFLDIKLLITGLFTITYEHSNLKIKPIFNDKIFLMISSKFLIPLCLQMPNIVNLNFAI